jgi:hypothetical protein
MDDPQDELEVYLRQFRPRAPRAGLDRLQPPSRVPRPWLSAAAVLAAVAATYAGWSVGRSWRGEAIPEVAVTAPRDPAREATVGWLSRAAHSGPASLDRALLDASPRLLLHVDRPESVLRGLAKE